MTMRFYWNPSVVYGPLAAAHAAATEEAAAVGQALAPGRIQVNAAPTGTFTAALTATGPGAVFQEEGAKPHVIAPRQGKVLAGPKFGPVSGKVDHPGNPALHFTRKGAESYRAAFVNAARALFHRV